MRIRIDRIYGIYYHPDTNKYVLIARCYINGQWQYRRMTFVLRTEAEAVEEGSWIDY